MKIKKIMFIHPSRGRPAMATAAMLNITQTMTSNVPFTYYLSIDSDDPEKFGYCSMCSSDALTGLIIGKNPNEVVQATNRAAAMLTDEDLIVAQTDDYRFNAGWDKQLIDFVESLNTNMALVYYPEYANKAMAVPQILTSDLYKKLGYVFYPEYVSMYADNDLFEAAQYLHAAYPLTPISFTHLHPGLNNAREMDETTKRTNAEWKYTQGKNMLERRRKENFNL